VGVRAGFSVLELACVVSIVMVLGAISVPALSRARSKAVEIACLSNMRSTGLAVFAYAQDSGGVLPFYDWRARAVTLRDGQTRVLGGRRGLMGGTWAVMIPEVWNGERVGRAYKCPSQRDWEASARVGPSYTPSQAWFLPAYWMSVACWLDPGRMRPGMQWSDFRPRANGLHDVAFPSSKALFFEQVGFCVNEPGAEEWKYVMGQTPTFRASAGLFDGSVRRFRRVDGLPAVRWMPLADTVDGVRGRDVP
jgi:type II secretory pathway pseudopilin PulG